MSRVVYIVDYIRTPIGRYGGGLAPVRTDELAAAPIIELIGRNAGVDWAALDDVTLGCTNQAGEDNRNVGRMAGLLAGLPVEVPGTTVNRLCGSGMEAVVQAARAIGAGDSDLIVAGGVESMSRAPHVIPKPESAYARTTEIASTTLGWRLVNPRMEAMGHTDPLGMTAENVAEEYGVSREDQDAFALRSQQRTAVATEEGRLAEEIVPVAVPQRRGDDVLVEQDEHPRSDTTLEKLAALRPAFRGSGTVTAGNSSGINDGAAGLLLASEKAVERFDLTPLAVVGMSAVAGVPPRIMGIGPIPATRKLLARAGLDIGDFDVVELNEAFASQSLACLRELGFPTTPSSSIPTAEPSPSATPPG